MERGASSQTPFLDAYFQRIGYGGERAVTLKVLTDLHRRHVKAIPFENLNPFMGREVSLNLSDLEEKLIWNGRGGYCYEHNHLFQEVLLRLGFEARGLIARVYWGASDEARPPATHMLLLVTIAQENYIVDTGFGAMTLTGPLRLDRRGRQQTPHEPFRLLEEGGTYAMQTLEADTWRTLYKFDLRECWPADYEVANWHVSHHPDSSFVSNLIAARVDDGCRHILLNSRYTVRTPEGRVDRRNLDNVGEVLALIKETMKISLPDEDALRIRIRHLLETGRKELQERNLA